MKIINFSDARNKIKRVVNRVVKYPYRVIMRRNAEDAVVMSLDQRLLKSPANREHLSKSIKQYHANKGENNSIMGPEGHLPKSIKQYSAGKPNEIILWTREAWTDYLYWQDQDRKTLDRINKIIRDTRRSPFEGIGKPEPMKKSLVGFWSRRIDKTNRLVYAFDDNRLSIISCRYHYEK